MKIIKNTAKTEYKILFVAMFIILLVLSRYLVNGTPVDVRSDMVETEVALFDGIKIQQPLIIEEDMNWRQGYYAVQFGHCDRDCDGVAIFTLVQGEHREEMRIPLSGITEKADTRLKELNFEKLESGEAQLTISTEGVSETQLTLCGSKDYYGFGNISIDDMEQNITLAQVYHYHVMTYEYILRLVCFGVVILGFVGLCILVVRTNGPTEENPKVCRAAFAIMTVLFMAMIYIFDSSIYLEPTYAEAVTNFLHYAREESFAANLLITDAGYLPLFQRLITLLYVKVLRIPSAYVLYIMQLTACFLCSMTWAFFVLHPFCQWMRLQNRILVSLLLMITCFCEETIFFTNFVYWGIALLLLLMISRMEEFTWIAYIVLLVCGALICLSKGAYVIMLPFMLIYLIFFYSDISLRKRIYAGVISAASLMQLLYSFGGSGEGSSWISGENMGQIGYWIKLICRMFIEFSAYLLAPFGTTVQSLRGLIVVLAVIIGIAVMVGFVKKILLPGIHGEKRNEQWIAIYTMILFQFIVIAFYLVTVKSIPGSWSGICRIHFDQMGDKYEIFSNVAYYMLLIVGSGLVKQAVEVLAVRSGKWKCAGAIAGQYGILLVLVLFCISNPMLRLSGWSEAKASDSRVYEKDINASWWNSKGIISENAFFVPVRADNWAYSRNITLYQVGSEQYFEETSGINLGEIESGYHAEYRVTDPEVTNNLIEIMIDRPMRIGMQVYQAELLDAEGHVLAVAEQLDANQNRKCIFRLQEPVSGTQTIRIVDGEGNPVYYKDYIAWACAW